MLTFLLIDKSGQKGIFVGESLLICNTELIEAYWVLSSLICSKSWCGAIFSAIVTLFSRCGRFIASLCGTQGDLRLDHSEVYVEYQSKTSIPELGWSFCLRVSRVLWSLVVLCPSQNGNAVRFSMATFVQRNKKLFIITVSNFGYFTTLHHCVFEDLKNRPSAVR